MFSDWEGRVYLVSQAYTKHYTRATSLLLLLRYPKDKFCILTTSLTTFFNSGKERRSPTTKRTAGPVDKTRKAVQVQYMGT